MSEPAKPEPKPEPVAARFPPAIPPIRAEGPTPAGGAYSIMYQHGDGRCEIVEFDAEDRAIRRTYGVPD